jgi:predicted TIM-barrel fold metal-dependent hydrolase
LAPEILSPGPIFWGSDWFASKRAEQAGLADDAILFDLLAQWVPDEAMRNRILVDNPAKLYGFA